MCHFSKWRPPPILDFIYFQNFNCLNGKDGQIASSCQILCRSVKPLLRYVFFRFFQDGVRPQSWICDARAWAICVESTGSAGNFAPVLTEVPGQTSSLAPVPLRAVLKLYCNNRINSLHLMNIIAILHCHEQEGQHPLTGQRAAKVR